MRDIFYLITDLKNASEKDRLNVHRLLVFATNSVLGYSTLFHSLSHDLLLVLCPVHVQVAVRTKENISQRNLLYI